MSVSRTRHAPRGSAPPAHAAGTLAALPKLSRDLVLASAHQRRFRAGERLVRQGEGASSLFLIESGRAAVRLVTPLGESVILTILGPGEMFDGARIFSGRRERTATVQALDYVTAQMLREADVTQLRQEHPGLNDFFLQMQARQVDRLSQLVLEAHHLSVDKRIARRLYEVGRLYPADLQPAALPLTQDEVAQLAGTTRHTANEVLKRLEADDVITLHQGKVVLLRVQQLMRLCAW